LANAVGRAVAQVGGEFLPTAADGIDMQAGDQGNTGIAAVALLVGFDGGEPAALLLVEAAEQEVHACVKFLIGMRFGLLARRTLALMNVTNCHVRLLLRELSEGVSVANILELVFRCLLRSVCEPA
jgi:hypothetical protein